MFSLQSLILAGAGTPRYGRLGALVDGRVRVSSGATHPTPSWGQAPALHSSASTDGVGGRNDELMSRFGTAKMGGDVVEVEGHPSRIGVRDMSS